MTSSINTFLIFMALFPRLTLRQIHHFPCENKQLIASGKQHTEGKGRKTSNFYLNECTSYSKHDGLMGCEEESCASRGHTQKMPVGPCELEIGRTASTES